MKHILFSIKDFNLEFSDDSFFIKEEIPPSNYDDDIDQRIHNYLILNDKNIIKSFTLPISISENFMEFSGLTFAHHVRLSRNLSFCDAPIIFYGAIELEQIMRLTPLARILITSNVLYVNITKYSFDDIQRSIERYEIKKFHLNQFLEQIVLNPPVNYDTHHSIDNEFALIQWSKYIGCFESLSSQFKKQFNSHLYFKYLRIKSPLPEIKNHNLSELSTTEKIKILLVDDEAKKGWANFYESFFKNSNIEFKDTRIEFKNIEKEALIAAVESILLKDHPDVVLLDLRLHDSDFDKNSLPENFTGIKILEKIKKINKGIQVIITTASNKAWNFNLVKQKGAYDFIIKDGFESPEIVINKVRQTIENASNRSYYLKPIYNKMVKALNSWSHYNIPKRKNINDQMYDSLWQINLKLQINDFVNNAFDTINNDSIVERYTISTLLLYRVIEMINEFYIVESGDNWKGTNQYHFDQDNSKVPKISYTQNKYDVNSNLPIGTTLSTKEKCYAIYNKVNSETNIDLFGKIHRLSEYRNKVAIHPNKRFQEESLEYLYDNDFTRFNRLLKDYFDAILDYIDSFK